MEYLPPYEEYKSRQQLTLEQQHFIKKSRNTIRAILSGQDPRQLLIVGPCSIHDRDAAIEYACRLHSLSEEVSSHFFIVMRTYFEKSRSSLGWKGFFYDPFLNSSHHMTLGIEWSRQLLLDLATMEVPTATEFLDPLTAYYYDDLISWGSIGARTSSSQPHRQFASGLDMPVGFKNGIAGNVSAAVNGVLVASQPHHYLGLSDEGRPILKRTVGNPDAHIVLRGGESGPNYDADAVAQALSRLEHAHLPLCLVIDCSHHNSHKKFERQIAVFQSAIGQIADGNNRIRGMMLESHLHSGKQAIPSNLSQLSYGVSITDGCLDWDSTAELIEWGATALQQQGSTAETANICGFA